LTSAVIFVTTSTAAARLSTIRPRSAYSALVEIMDDS
jgi:hypothetical protein